MHLCSLAISIMLSLTDKGVKILHDMLPLPYPAALGKSVFICWGITKYMIIFTPCYYSVYTTGCYCVACYVGLCFLDAVM